MKVRDREKVCFVSSLGQIIFAGLQNTLKNILVVLIMHLQLWLKSYCIRSVVLIECYA